MIYHGLNSLQYLFREKKNDFIFKVLKLCFLFCLCLRNNLANIINNDLISINEPDQGLEMVEHGFRGLDSFQYLPREEFKQSRNFIENCKLITQT